MSKINLSPIQPFDEWRPDLGEFSNGATIADGCISYGGVYKPFDSLQAATSALSDDCRGAFSMRALNGTTHTFAGTSTGLYKLSGTSWVDVTRASGAYSGSADSNWTFCNYGDLVIATNYADDIQVYDVSIDTQFSQLSSTAPRARYVFVINNFLVALDTVDDDGVKSTRVRWSPIGDPKGDWTPNIDTQAGFNDLRGGGFANIAGTGSQDYGNIIQDNAIWRMEYVGGDAIFSFDLQESERGTKIARSVVSNGVLTYFIDEDGIYAYDGRASVSIGRNKVDRWFLQNFNSTYDYNLTTAIDPINKLLVISFPSVGVGSATPDTLLIYNETDQRWTRTDQSVQLIFGHLTTGYTLESLAAEYPVLEEVPYSLDSRFWQGGRFLFGAITTDKKLGAFNGQPYTAVVGTAETRLNENGVAMVSALIPYIEDGTVTARVGYRSNLSDNPVYTDYLGANSITGEIDVYQEGKYLRGEFTIEGTWYSAKGFAYRYKNKGTA